MDIRKYFSRKRVASTYTADWEETSASSESNEKFTAIPYEKKIRLTSGTAKHKAYRAKFSDKNKRKVSHR